MPVARREARIELTLDPKGMDSGIDGARRRLRGIFKEAKGEGGASFGGAAKKVGSGALFGLGQQATSGALSAIQSTVSGVFDVEKALTRLQIVGDMSNKQLAEFRGKLTEVSDASGISRKGILEGTSAYVDLTGDVEGATSAMSVFARTAQASDSSMADIATAAATMRDSMKIAPGELESTFSGLINQGKKGAVTLRNMAGEFPSLLSKFSRFGVTGREGTIELGAMFQTVRKGFGTAEEASTGLQAMMGGIVKHADRFAKAGVQVFNVGKDGTKTLKPMSEIITKIGESKLAKDPQLLNKAFGRGEGEQAYQMLKGHVDMLREMEQAGKDAGAVQRDLDTYMQSSAGRIDTAMERAKNRIAEAFTPERIDKFADGIEGLASKVQTLADGLGFVVDKLNGIVDVGKDVRGAISGNNNPYKQYGDEARWFGIGLGKTDKVAGLEKGIEMASGSTDPRNIRARERMQGELDRGKANYGSYESTVASIMGAEVNEKSTPASIRRAVEAEYTARGLGAGGQQVAAVNYLGSAGVSPERREQLMTGYKTEDLTRISAPIIEAMKKAIESAHITVKVGSEPVVKAAGNATRHRTGTAH